MTGSHGDTLCAVCWRTVPATLKRSYLSAWRAADIKAERHAARRMVRAAKRARAA
jgi:hypothetical protein